jgi:hypothetical protein
MLSRAATNTNSIVSLTQPGLKLTIYHTQEQSYHYTTDAVQISFKQSQNLKRMDVSQAI